MAYRKFKSYKEKLLDERWLKRREEILLRDGYECQYCYSRDFLNVHHIQYFNELEPWEYDDKYLITLCKCCHEWDHWINQLKEFQREKIRKYEMV